MGSKQVAASLNAQAAIHTRLSIVARTFRLNRRAAEMRFGSRCADGPFEKVQSTSQNQKCETYLTLTK